jgi:phage terminase large subunit GpA-like protein
MAFEQQLKTLYNSHAFKFEPEDLTPSQWIEKNRYVQRHVSERIFGQFDFKNSPYMRQIVDHLSPYDPVNRVVLMKGVRTSGTFTLVDNGTCYVMDQRPTNILVLSANKELATKAIEGIDSAIDGCNIRHLLGKGSKVQSNSKGDTMQSKFFSGGFKLFNFGGQSAANFRQVTAGLVIFDELDAAKGYTKQAGNSLELIEDRTRSAGDAKKIVYISSPLLTESSLIYDLYLRGNQNVYYVPCPHCGEMIELVWNERNENNTRYGVIFDVKNDEVIEDSVRYRCGLCENEFKDNKKLKLEILNAGKWAPSIERENKKFVSYRISALYAHPSMDRWYDFAVKYQLAWPRGGVKDQGSLQSFTNSIEGLPFKPEGITIKSNRLQQNRREYKINECPYELSKKDGNGEIMLITLSCDLNGYENDGRLDFEVLAHSERGATYSVDADSVGTFIPKVERDALQKEGINVAQLEYERTKYTYKFDVQNSIWDEFEKIVMQKFGKLEKPINIIAVDIGAFQDYAVEFIRRMRQKNLLCIGVKGEDPDKFIIQSRIEVSKWYREMTLEAAFLLNVNAIKDQLAKYIESNSYVDDNGQMHQDENFMNFPEYDTKINKYTFRNFFAHFESEHKIVKKTEGNSDKILWEKKKTGIQNHFWDVRVYNVFCRIFMQDLICSNSNPFKKRYYKSTTIKPTWENTCALIREAALEKGRALS